MSRKVVLVIVLALGFSGCAAIRTNQTHWTEQLLTAAGFRVEPAGTAEERARLQALRPRKVVQEERDGERRYVYADPEGCTCLYVGNEQQYQKYQKLKIQKDGVPESLEPLALALIRQVGLSSLSS
jgi:hypothetical protein